VGNANCEKELTSAIGLAVDSCVAIFSACYSYFKNMRQFYCLHYTLAWSLFSCFLIRYWWWNMQNFDQKKVGLAQPQVTMADNYPADWCINPAHWLQYNLFWHGSTMRCAWTLTRHELLISMHNWYNVVMIQWVEQIAKCKKTLSEPLALDDRFLTGISWHTPATCMLVTT